ncbi:MAG: protein jag [Ruminococcus sp.]|jgi:spoIIIJ-associated protein|nr:protein jag [Ruminococcus sp.]
MREEFKASTIEEAKAAAAAKFSAAIADIEFTVLEEPKKGLFGIGKTDAAVLAVYEPKTKGVVAYNYVKEILRNMGIGNEVVLREENENAFIDIVGDAGGVIIGRRGETLDAVQYLASMCANKGTKDYFRVTLDCNGYREKREDILRDLAKKLSSGVLRSGKSASLEPMNPYERRIIHSAVSEIEGVSSKSIGEEPYRRVVISSLNPPKFTKSFDRPKRPDGRGDRPQRTGGGDRRNGTDRDRRPKKDGDLPRKPVDMMKSSFEREYKKPKPEDTMLGAGSLYDRLDI